MEKRAVIYARYSCDKQSEDVYKRQTLTEQFFERYVFNFPLKSLRYFSCISSYPSKLITKRLGFNPQYSSGIRSFISFQV